MEPEEVYYKKDRKNNCFCIWIIGAIIAIVLSFFIGVLVAELTTIIATLGIGAIIALIVILAVLLIIAIINLICCKKPEKKKCCY